MYRRTSQFEMVKRVDIRAIKHQRTECRAKDEDEDVLLSSEDAVQEAMDEAGQLVQVNRSKGKSLEQGRKEQLGSLSSSQQLLLEGSSWSSCMEVERSCHGGPRHGDSHDNCLGSC